MTPTRGHTSVRQPVQTYIHHLCRNTRCCQEDLLTAIYYRVGTDSMRESSESMLLVGLHNDDDDGDDDNL